MYLILGHLVGDYLLQTHWMAHNKIRWDLAGYWACFIHSLFYSLSVATVLWLGNQDFAFTVESFLVLVVLIFLTHFPIDKGSLAKYWLKICGHKMPQPNGAITLESLFGLFYYVVVDNTMHLILMIALIKWAFPELSL